MMYNLSNLGQFLFDADIDTINEFIGEPKAIYPDKNVNEVNDDTKEFIYRLAKAIRQNKPNCSRRCIFRRN